VPFFCEVNNKTFDVNIELMGINEQVKMTDNENMKAVLLIIKNTKESYEKHMLKFNKIIGQERIKLIEYIDKLFIHLFSLYYNIIQKDSGIAKNNDLKLIFDVKANKYIATCKLDEKDISSMNDFGKNFETFILKNIKNLFNKYKEILEDNKNEKMIFTEICIIIDSIFYYILIIRYNLEKI
jgi:hypothetical protein